MRVENKNKIKIKKAMLTPPKTPTRANKYTNTTHASIYQKGEKPKKRKNEKEKKKKKSRYLKFIFL